MNDRIGAAANEAASAMLDQATEKKRQAELMSALIADPKWVLFANYVDTEASMYIQQLLDPMKQEFQAHYIRGLVKGMDLAKTLPERILRIYHDEVAAVANPRHNVAEGAPAEAGLRLSPTPEEAQ